MASSLSEITFELYIGGTLVNSLPNTNGQATIIVTKPRMSYPWTRVLFYDEYWCRCIYSYEDPDDQNRWIMDIEFDSETTGTQRFANAHAKASDLTAEFSVMQEEGVPVTTLSGEIVRVTPDGTLPNSESTLRVYVKTTNGVDALSSADTVSGFMNLIEVNHGVTILINGISTVVTEFVFRANANSTLTARSTTINFTVAKANYSDTENLTLTVNQEAGVQQGSISVDNVEAFSEEESASALVTLADVDPTTLSVVSKPSWVSSANFTTDATGTHLNLVFSKNTLTEPRDGSIVISGTDTYTNTLNATCAIRQSGTVYGTIEVDSMSAKADDASISVPVTTEDMNLGSLSANVVGLGFITNATVVVSGSDVTLNVSFSENETHDERVQAINIQGYDNRGHSISSTVYLTQAGAKYIKDRIYRIDYVNGEFVMVRGKFDENSDPSEEGIEYELNKPLYEGDLGLDQEYPIESVVYQESKDVNKIYWVDGKNVLRFANITEKLSKMEKWDDTSFDTNRLAKFDVKVDISKENSGNTRANGITQYLITYFNKYGQETGAVWFSDLVYLSPNNKGGAADEYNNNIVTLEISNLDQTYDHFRVYSIFRSSRDGQIAAYLVEENEVKSGTVTVIDDGAHLTSEDPTRLLYLGSQFVKPGTIEHKDQVLFLGDLKEIGRKKYENIENIIRSTMFDFVGGETEFTDGVTYKSKCIEFIYSGSAVYGGRIPMQDAEYIKDISEFGIDDGLYSYENQLKLTSSEILSFKGGEKYRFALKFKDRNGVETDAFWIGDAENELYPIINDEVGYIKRICAMCTLPAAVIQAAKDEGFKTVQLCIAEATYADRAVKAQGVINPTMFNVWERYVNRIYAMPSWMTRVRGSEYPNRHFEVLDHSQNSTAEVQCNWWADEAVDHNAFFQFKDYDGSNPNPTILSNLGYENNYDYIMFAYRIRYKQYKRSGYSIFGEGLGGTPIADVLGAMQSNKVKYKVLCYVIKAKFINSGTMSDLDDLVIPAYDDEETKANGRKTHVQEFNETWVPDVDPDTGRAGYSCSLPKTNPKAKLFLTTFEFEEQTIFNKGGAKTNAYKRLIHELTEMSLAQYAPQDTEFIDWCTWATKAGSPHKYRIYVNKGFQVDEITANTYNSMRDAVNATPPQNESRWIIEEELETVGNDANKAAAFRKKHLMFIDENVVTLDSPELEKEVVSFDKNDNMRFRIVGIAKMNSVISDYTIDATHSSVDGSSYDKEQFSGKASETNKLTGLISWPIWREYSLRVTRDAMKKYPEKEAKERSSGEYELGSNIIRYMIYMWQHDGSISGFTGRTDTTNEEDETETTVIDNDYSKLNHKTFANLRYSKKTVYLRHANMLTYENLGEVRMSREFGSNLIGINIGSKSEDYFGNVQFSLSMPGNLKYPLYYSNMHKDNTYETISADGAFIYSSIPVRIEYGTKTHAVICLGTNENYPGTYYDPVTHQDVPSGAPMYRQNILPYIFTEEIVDFSKVRENNYEVDDGNGGTRLTNVTGALLPWINHDLGYRYLYLPPVTVNAFVYVSEAASDANHYYDSISVSDTGSGLVYVTAIQNALTKASVDDEEVYMTIRLATGWMSVRNISSASITHDETNHKYNITFVDSKSIAYSDGSDLNPGQTEKTVPVRYMTVDGSGNVSDMGYGTLHVYNDTIDNNQYKYKDYSVHQPHLEPIGNDGSDIVKTSDKYVFIGELYNVYEDIQHDPRYGGIDLAHVEQNRFITAGPQFVLDNMRTEDEEHHSIENHIYANQGDTYIQRWDSLRVKPYSKDAVNQNIDICSVMLESHICLDGRTDLQRGIQEIASIDIEKFNSINNVYSQQNNFDVRRDTDESANLDTFRSSITWTLPKADMADIDEWTHITLGSSLKLDGDKGPCQAIRRFANRLLAFQDRGVSEIYFNALTQVGTQEGVPIEIANSGKVNGKSYFTNRYGCSNKWSIIEGKAALYFIDNINKALCNVIVGQRGQLGASDISTDKGFGVWFKRHNSMNTWNPKDFDNFVSFYDKVNSDVYIVNKSSDDDAPAIVFNENLGQFTSFFDYGSVPMIVNVGDRLVSFKEDVNGYNKLWLQNEGKFCNFFGTQYDFWTQYRITPDPYGDKIWTNIEYRADFYKILDNNGNELTSLTEKNLIDALADFYQPDETFSFIRFWNEYQSTNINETNTIAPDKKFRIWRYQIPRARKTTDNLVGLDRMRNPWLNILVKKKYTSALDEANKELMQMHDMDVIYFE